MINSVQKKIIILGAGGHCTVIYDCLKLLNFKILGFIDKSLPTGFEKSKGFKCLGNDNYLINNAKYENKNVFLVNGIGSTIKTDLRKNIYNHFVNSGYAFIQIVHPNAFVSNNVMLSSDCQIMSGANIQPEVNIGKNVLINTGSNIDHGSKIKDHVHIAPGVTISGNVIIGEGTHIGTSVTIVQNIKIGENCFIGAGVTVLKDVPPNTFISPKENLVWK